MKVRIIGFYKGQFMNQEVLLLDKDDVVAMNLLRQQFWGVIKRIKG